MNTTNIAAWHLNSFMKGYHFLTFRESCTTVSDTFSSATYNFWMPRYIFNIKTSKCAQLNSLSKTLNSLKIGRSTTEIRFFQSLPISLNRLSPLNFNMQILAYLLQEIVTKRLLYIQLSMYYCWGTLESKTYRRMRTWKG